MTPCAPEHQPMRNQVTSQMPLLATARQADWGFHKRDACGASHPNPSCNCSVATATQGTMCAKFDHKPRYYAEAPSRAASSPSQMSISSGKCGRGIAPRRRAPSAQRLHPLSTRNSRRRRPRSHQRLPRERSVGSRHASNRAHACTQAKAPARHLPRVPRLHSLQGSRDTMLKTRWSGHHCLTRTRRAVRRSCDTCLSGRETMNSLAVPHAHARLRGLELGHPPKHSNNKAAHAEADPCAWSGACLAGDDRWLIRECPATKRDESCLGQRPRWSEATAGPSYAVDDSEHENRITLKSACWGPDDKHSLLVKSARCFVNCAMSHMPQEPPISEGTRRVRGTWRRYELPNVPS